MTFLNPLFLIGLIFTAVPVIIHLWFRKKLERIPFSTLKFLKRTEARRFGWLKIREIIILFLRCLLIACLVLILAKPQIKSNFLKPGHLASVVLIVDNSYSMAYGDNFHLAQDNIEKMLTRYSAKAEFAVFPLCTDNDQPAGEWIKKGSVQQVVDQITLTDQSGTINALSPNLSAQQARYPIEYVYVGDGQENTFADFPRDMFSEQDLKWIKIPTGNNITIEKVELNDPMALISDEYKLDVRIKNSGTRTWTGEVVVENKDYSRKKQCEIPADHETVLSLTLPIRLNRGTVRFYDDSLSIDNTYFFSKSLPRKMEVLIAGTARFLKTGLNPGDRINRPFSLTTVNSLSTINLQRFDIIIINGLEEISKSDKIKLDTFLKESNKGIICFLGRSVGVNLHNFIGRCCRAEGYISATGYITLDWIDYDHEIFRIFNHSNLLEHIKIYNYQKLNSDKKTIAKLTGNDPFIITDNNLTVIATQLLPENSDIVYKSAFVPLLHRLIISTTQQAYDHELRIGDWAHQYSELKAPTGEYIASGQKLTTPGFYTTARETIGVNVVPEEGNLKTLGTQGARALNISIIDIEKDFESSDISSVLLLLALFILLLEILLLLIR